MNIDLLKKLVLLANHNSNEHEANSAARHVCKMLELSHFIVQSDLPKKQTKSVMSDVDYEAAIDKEWDAVWRHTGQK